MKPFSLNIKGQLREFASPLVMGIINVTDDSFYATSRVTAEDNIIRRACEMVIEGADILDVGAYSTRPGATVVSEHDELGRLESALKAIRQAVGNDVLVSVDTFRPEVARRCVADWGADIVNDVSGGTADERMFSTIAELQCPYILMHMRGTPQTMQALTDYTDVTADVIEWLSRRIYLLEEAGVSDIIVDPGFGFAKTLDQNYEMMANLSWFEELGKPVLVGISRKSMITKLLGIETDSALEATVALDAFALDRGASILRVHDVRAAKESVLIYGKLNGVKQ